MTCSRRLPSIVAEPLLRNVQVPRIGLIVSNVRGPDVPLYLAGARLVNYLPISIALDGMGLNVTAFSYAGTMRLCAISCREMLPDPAFFAECMQSAFDRLQEAVAARGGVHRGRGGGTAAGRQRWHASTPAGRAGTQACRARARRLPSPRGASHASAPRPEAMLTRDCMPAELRQALRDVFGDAVDDVVLCEHSWFARLHLGATATTRHNTIYLRGSAEDFFRDPQLLLHEYFHVLKQWNRGRMSLGSYLVEWWRRGYWQNRYEQQARRFVDRRLGKFHAALQRNALQTASRAWLRTAG